MARSLNRVQLIGNLTRDPELRYTPNGTAVCSFGLATNRSWTTDTGEKHEETEFHRIVSWNKLAELCSQFLTKGRKVYVEGRLSTRSWTAQDGTQRNATEVVIDDMILLDNKRPDESQAAKTSISTASPVNEEKVQVSPEVKASKSQKDKKKGEKGPGEDSSAETSENQTTDVAPDDIPF
ncbi:MAG: single-stranded DNA-binding protein [Candidatus Levybacteria bacterium]|nr:single-stranded DNA-binding protein [Candidatus Levybacteria bacterium]